jgi:Helix-turn-helix domain
MLPWPERAGGRSRRGICLKMSGSGSRTCGAGAGVRAIAEHRGRSPSTISRELRRNRDPGSGQYRPFTAHKLAVRRRARASTVSVQIEVAGEVLRLAVRDDGAGGADLTRGTGLTGLKDRVEALGGRIFLDSPSGAGTSLRAELPLTASNAGLTP